MVKTSSVVALAATVPMTLGAYTGFNTGSSTLSGAAKQQADFEAEFNAAHKLAGTNGAFTSSRLYTMIQAGTQNTVISAIPAALNTNTNLLLGLWASGTNNIDNELTALKNAIQQFPGLGQKCVGISVGSEDLYRVTPTGIANDAGVGQDPVVLAGFIGQVKEAIKGTGLSGCPVGHVDTWTAWQNSTANKAVIDAVDWAGTDGYPYFQTQSGDNSIEHAGDLFFDSVNVVKQAVGNKPVWVTETGFPWEGPTVGQAVANKDNAKTYWDNVYCKLKDQNINTFWYTLVDANSADKATFGVLGSDLNGRPVYDLSCDSASKTNSSSTAVSSPSATGGASVSTGGAQSGSHPEQSTPAAYTNIATTAGPQATQGASTPVYGGSNNTANPGQGSPAGTVVAGPAATPETTPAAGAGSGSGSGSTTTTGARPSTSGFTGAATSTKVASGSIFGLAAAAAAALFL